MTKAEETAPLEASLAPLRDEIDAIDRDLHNLLIERGEIIDRLIAVKARQGGGSAFRPAREADMMRRLVTRHRGILPLDTVEGIWRIIISTFTYVQSPYTVHADMSAGDAPMRDACRFHFGFTVPLAPHADAERVVTAVSAAPGDLGLVRIDDATPWWNALRGPGAPKIIARLPFVERADHAAGLPLYVVAKPLDDAMVQDVMLYAVSDVDPATAAADDILARGPRGLIAAATHDTTPAEIAASLACSEADVIFIGSHAARFELPQ